MKYNNKNKYMFVPCEYLILNFRSFYDFNNIFGKFHIMFENLNPVIINISSCFPEA